VSKRILFIKDHLHCIYEDVIDLEKLGWTLRGSKRSNVWHIDWEDKKCKINFRFIKEKYFKDNAFAWIWKLQIIYKITIQYHIYIKYAGNIQYKIQLIFCLLQQTASKISNSLQHLKSTANAISTLFAILCRFNFHAH